MTTPRPQRPAKIVREPDMHFRARVPVAPGVRVHLAEVVNTALAATLDLHRHVERAHWSVNAWQCASRHELFDRLAGNLASWIDLLAVRCATLGGHRHLSVGVDVTGGLPATEALDTDGLEPMAALVARYQAYVNGLRAIARDAATGERVTADVITEVVDAAELDQWFLESHAESGPAPEEAHPPAS